MTDITNAQIATAMPFRMVDGQVYRLDSMDYIYNKQTDTLRVSTLPDSPLIPLIARPAALAGLAGLTEASKMPAKRKSKYNAIATVVDGQRFDSRAEARYYEQLRLLQAAGEIKFFLMQVPFRLTGGIKYLADFIVFHTDGKVEVVDVKGVETAMFKAKKKMVESLYPVVVRVVK